MRPPSRHLVMDKQDSEALEELDACVIITRATEHPAVPQACRGSAQGALLCCCHAGHAHEEPWERTAPCPGSPEASRLR